jgi:hypothetical protein
MTRRAILALLTATGLWVMLAMAAGVALAQDIACPGGPCIGANQTGPIDGAIRHKAEKLWGAKAEAGTGEGDDGLAGMAGFVDCGGDVGKVYYAPGYGASVDCAEIAQMRREMETVETPPRSVDWTKPAGLILLGLALLAAAARGWRRTGSTASA